MRKIGIIGCGWLGTRIGEFLQEEYRIVATTRSKETELRSRGFEVVPADFSVSTVYNSLINSADALILSPNFPKENSEFWLENLMKFIGDFTNPIF